MAVTIEIEMPGRYLVNGRVCDSFDDLITCLGHKFGDYSEKMSQLQADIDELEKELSEYDA